MYDYKTYILKNYYGEDYELIPIRDRYAKDDTLAIYLYDAETTESFANVTVLIDDSSFYADNTHAFIDTNNNKWLEKFIKDNNLGTYAGVMGFNGYCSYPLYKFNLNKLNKGE